MALLERVSTLVRANINDLVDKAEDPEKMIKQVILDMQNQLLQVKTQVAISIADQHVLERKLKENEENEQQKENCSFATGWGVHPTYRDPKQKYAEDTRCDPEHEIADVRLGVQQASQCQRTV